MGGLFIVAGGVSQGLVNGFLNWQTGTDPFPIGFFPRLFAIGTSGANFLEYFGTDLLALITTIAIFMVIVYVESTRIEIPLAHTAVRGACAVPGEAHLCERSADDPRPGAAGERPDDRDVPLERRDNDLR